MDFYEILQNDAAFALFFLIYYALLPLLAQLLIVRFFRKQVSMQRYMFGVPTFLIGHAYLANLLLGLMMYDRNGDYIVRGANESLGLILFAVSFTAMVLSAIILRIFYKLEGKEYIRGLLAYFVSLLLFAGCFWIIRILFGY